MSRILAWLAERPVEAVLLGALAALIGAMAGGLALIGLGAVDVAASSPHTTPVYWATKIAMMQSVRRQAVSISAPARFTEADVAQGFRLYETHCVACHGAPGVGPAAQAAGLMPPPPYLLEAPRDWTPAELYWIVRNGVKMTGMPAWDRTLSEADSWRLVAFLERLPGLDTRAYCRLRLSQPACSGRPSAPLADAACACP